MIINKITKQFQTRSDKPADNWLDEDYIVVPDGSELANEIINNYPFINLIIEYDVLVDVEIDTEVKEQAEIIANNQNEIQELKQKLVDTDYKAIKYAEGLLTEEEYTPTKADRQAWRTRINELEEGA